METSQSTQKIERNERVTVSDALAYVTTQSGFIFEDRTFRRWCESGCVKVNDLEIEIETIKVGRLWFITRRSLEFLITQIR